jgi:hypothetical protein
MQQKTLCLQLVFNRRVDLLMLLFLENPDQAIHLPEPLLWPLLRMPLKNYISTLLSNV